MTRIWNSIVCLTAIGTLATIFVIKKGRSGKPFLRTTTPLPIISIDETHRRMSVLDPGLPLTKVPKLLHLTIDDTTTLHQMKVINYSIQSAESHGFKVMLHWDSDADNLVHYYYPELIDSWETLLNNTKIDRGARISDFMRILFLYHYGGVYIDAGVVPCGDLTKLINEPEVATSPLILSCDGQTVNCFMSGPPRHLVWEIALYMMKNNKNLATQPVLEATGPVMMRQAVDTYFDVTEHPVNTNFDVTKTPTVARLLKGEHIPKPEDEGIWQRRGLMKNGSLGKGKASSVGLDTLKKLGLVHLTWGYWMGDMVAKQTACNTGMDLIEVFLDFACENVDKVATPKWSDCHLIEGFLDLVWKGEVGIMMGGE